MLFIKRYTTLSSLDSKIRNELADKISKICDYDGRFASQSFFIKIDKLWGPHTTDHFANSCNTKLTRFNSLFWCPGTEAVDAFSQDWSADINWLVPPIFFIASVIKYMIACKSQRTLIGPCWPSAPFWPLFYKTKYQRYSYVKDILFIEHPNEFLNVGNYKGSLLGSSEFKSSIFAARSAVK